MTTSSNTDPTPADRLRVVHYLDMIREEEGGVVRAVLDLTLALAEQGVEVTLLTGDAADAPAEWRSGKAGVPGVQVIERTTTPWKTLAGDDRTAVGDAIEWADVVHLHTPWDRYNLAVAAQARRQLTPYVVSIHGMLDDWSIARRGAKKRAYLALAGRRMLEGAARLHFTAEGERTQAMKWTPRANASVLPLVMDLSPYRELPGPDAARAEFACLGQPGPKLLFLSRVHPKKGVELLIEAVALLRKAGREVTAVVAGPGEADYLAQLKRLAESLGVADATHFLGMVRGDAKLSLYQACDLFVLPTNQENFGIVLTEAMACGTPVVTTRGVDIWPELSQRGAEIVDSSAAALTEAVERLLAEGSALAERGRAGREAVFDWLDPQRVTRGYIDLYRECYAINE